MVLNKLLDGLDCKIIYPKNKNKNINILGLFINSKKVKKNSLYFCVDGFSVNGENFVFEAVKNGAVVIVSEKKLNNINCAQVIVKNVREAMCIIAGNFYGNAHKELKIVGIVGTNGKSSTCYITYNILKTLNENIALIGTNEIIINNKSYTSKLTTPDPIELHYLFKKILDSGTKIVVMEVSSHAIFLKKVYGIKFEILGLTNVASDHLDFFKSQETYENTKKSIFLGGLSKNYIINLDDKVGQELNGKIRAYSYAINKKATLNIKFVLGHTVKINYNSKKYFFKNGLIGRFNLYNQAIAILICHILNFSFEDIVKAISQIKSIAGRMNVYQKNGKIAVVDYAHTTQSLIESLKTIKKQFKRDIVAVVGCPGNRDEYKRKEFGKILNKHCFFVFLTADNPKYENPYRIMREMSKALPICKYVMIENRKKAIKFAANLFLLENFTLVIIGKGIEPYQDINGKKVRHSDIIEIEKFFK